MDWVKPHELPGKPHQCLRFWLSSPVVGDVLEDILKPTLSFLGPLYFCHERMRCPICSLEMVRFASESASPRSTMT
jgi:hypothetical protein